jgi:hypothetical protein
MTVPELLKYVVPIVAGVVASVVSTAFIGPRKLRNDLSTDSEMVDRIPEGARAELARDIERRTLTLVSLSRFPSLSAFEVLQLAGVLGLAAVEVWLAVHDYEQSVVGGKAFLSGEGSVLVALFFWSSSVVFWRQFYGSWSERAADRLDFIERHIGTIEAEPVSRLMRIGLVASMDLAIVGVVAPPMALLITKLATGLEPAGLVWVAGSMVVVVPAISYFGVSRDLFGSRRDSESGRLGKSINRLIDQRIERERTAARDPEASERLADGDRGQAKDRVDPERP